MEHVGAHVVVVIAVVVRVVLQLLQQKTLNGTVPTKKLGEHCIRLLFIYT